MGSTRRDEIRDLIAQNMPFSPSVATRDGVMTWGIRPWSEVLDAAEHIMAELEKAGFKIEKVT